MEAYTFFASDNNSGAHPRVIEAIDRANQGFCSAYGEDPWTAEAAALLRQIFGHKARPWFVFLGTAANILGLKSLIRSHNSVLCPASAHINVDECGAPEAIIGCKLITIPADNGKIRLEDCLPALEAREAVHHSYPLVLSITQTTECGTVYSLDELTRIGEFCRANKLYFHMDGARLSHAAAYLGVSLKSMTTDVGVDVLSFGGTKNGLLMGEAVVFLNSELGQEFGHIRKQHMQLGSKMRFIAAQFTEYLKDGLWLENALAANRMAAMLADGIQDLDHVRIVYPVESNLIFARMPKKIIADLNKEFYFYTVDTMDAPGYPKEWPMVRLMASFNTKEEQVREFIRAIRAAG